jgi:tRNA (guanine-N7-)-methyltransferase
MPTTVSGFEFVARRAEDSVALPTREGSGVHCAKFIPPFQISDFSLQMAAVETQPALDRTIIVRPPSYVERLNVSALFPKEQPLEIELGAGDGSFLVHWAAMNAQMNFLGIERLLGRLRKIERKARRLGLANVRALRIEASYFAEFLLPAGVASAFHIYFPDPWPKRKHRQHRLLNEHFTEVLRAALVQRGAVYLRTDDTDYFAQMTAVFGANGNFEAVPTPERLASVLTDFEREFNTRGISTNRAGYRRIN